MGCTSAPAPSSTSESQGPATPITPGDTAPMAGNTTQGQSNVGTKKVVVHNGATRPRRSLSRPVLFALGGACAFLVGALTTVLLTGNQNIGAQAGTTKSGPIGAAPTITANQLNEVRVGMSIDEGSRVAGWPLQASYYDPDGNGSHACGSATLEGGPAGISFMTSYDTIKTVEVSNLPTGSDSSASTPEGIRLGDPMALVKVKYPGQYTEIRDQYMPGTPKLRVHSKGSGSAGNELLFAGDQNARIVSIKGGSRQWAELAEGCL